MTDSILKSVFTLDTETQTYRPAAHNLNAAEAVEQLNSGATAKVVDQAERHRTSDPRKCRTCKKASDEITSKHVESSAGPEHEQKIGTEN